MVRMPAQHAVLRGRDAPLLVHPIERVERLAAIVGEAVAP
jgi:hypothetical protein